MKKYDSLPNLHFDDFINLFGFYVSPQLRTYKMFLNPTIIMNLIIWEKKDMIFFQTYTLIY